jgi:hypothetical protein
MPTARSFAVTLAAALLALPALAPAAGAATGSWSPTQGFTAGPRSSDVIVPRAAIARDGTSAVAFTTQAGALMVATGSANGRFGAPRLIDRSGAHDPSVAAARGGAFVVAWEEADGIHAALRTKAGRRIVQRRFTSRPSSDINGVQVAADPLGGWVIAERVFPQGRRQDRLYGVRVLSLDPAGRALGPIQDLGPGSFGVDARPTQALAVDGNGRAVLAFTRESPSGAPPSADAVVVATRPHGGTFGPPVAVAAPYADDPRVAVDDSGRAAVAFTQVASRGDAGSFGAPALVTVRADGTLSAPVGPALEFPRRAFGPTAALMPGGAAVVFALKAKSEAFVTEAPVRAVAIADDGTVGPLQTLTDARAKEPVAMALSRGRVLVVWSGRRGLGASLATNGRFRRTAEPQGPPPAPYHFNSTNRDLRTAGRYAIFTWAVGGRVRVAVRGF